MAVLTDRLDGIAGPHRGQPILTAGVAPEQARAAMVLVHGRGASASDILQIARAVGHEGGAYLAPQATGHTWYPQSFLQPLAANEPSLSSALAAVGATLAVAAAAGIPPERTILLGFSQGACLASEFAARHARRYGGLVVLSGGLIGSGQREDAAPPDDKLFDYAGSLDGTPVFLGCSDVDPHIPLRRVQQSTEALRALGGEVTERIYPGMGHTVNEDELAFVRTLVASVAGGGAATGDA